jgi:fermentation-respiration switch protein FrsA (DUF1100 family)
MRIFGARSRRSAVGLFACAVVAGAVGLVVSVLAVGLLLASPARTAIGAPPPDLRAEIVAIPSASGALLSGWLVPGQAGGGAVVLMHGVRANRLSMVSRARRLKGAGFAVLLFDFQAHGESSGGHITFGHLESLDAQAAVAFLHARLPRERIGVIGESLGGAAALLGPQPLPVDCLVLESVYSDIDHALGNRLRVVLGPAGPVLTPLLVPIFEFVLQPVLGISAQALRPIDHISAVTAPLLIASGTADDRTTVAEAQSLYDRAQASKQFWAVEGARHVDLEAYAPDTYWEVVMPFLIRALRHGD